MNSIIKKKAAAFLNLRGISDRLQVLDWYHVDWESVKYDVKTWMCFDQIRDKYFDIIERGALSKTSAKCCSSVKERTIWICWFQGIDNAPLIVKKCIQSIRNWGGGRK